MSPFIFGIISDHISSKKTITITLVIWLFVILVAAFVNTVGRFYLIGLLAGLAIGPLFYGIVPDISSERIATLGLGLFFIAGLIILQGAKTQAKNNMEQTAKKI